MEKPTDQEVINRYKVVPKQVSDRTVLEAKANSGTYSIYDEARGVAIERRNYQQHGLTVNMPKTYRELTDLAYQQTERFLNIVEVVAKEEENEEHIRMRSGGTGEIAYIHIEKNGKKDRLEYLPEYLAKNIEKIGIKLEILQKIEIQEIKSQVKNTEESVESEMQMATLEEKKELIKRERDKYLAYLKGSTKYYFEKLEDAGVNYILIGTHAASDMMDISGPIKTLANLNEEIKNQWNAVSKTNEKKESVEKFKTTSLEKDISEHSTGKDGGR